MNHAFFILFTIVLVFSLTFEYPLLAIQEANLKQKSSHTELRKEINKARSITLSNPAASISILEELNIFENDLESDTIEYIRYYETLGYGKMRLGAYDQSLNAFNKALELALESKNQIWEARVYDSLATLFKYLKDYEQSEKFELRAINLFTLMDDTLSISLALNNYGHTLLKQNQYEEALINLNESLRLKSQLNSDIGIGTNFNNIGKALIGLNRIDTAIQIIKKSIPIKKEERAFASLINSFNNLAEAKILIGQYDLAKQTLDSSIFYSKFTKANLELTDTYLLYKNLYDLQGKPDSAYRYFQQYTIMQDSLFNVPMLRNLTNVLYDFRKYELKLDLLEKTNQLQLAEIEKSRQQKKFYTYYLLSALVFLVFFAILFFKIRNQNKKLKNQQINLINKNELIEQQKKKIENENRLKDKILFMLSHNIRSPLASLKGIMSLFAGGHLTQSEASENFKKIGAMMTNVMIQLDNLISWSHIDPSDVRINKEKIQFTQFLHQLSLQLVEKGYNVATYEENKQHQPSQMWVDTHVLALILENILIEFQKINPKEDNQTFLNFDVDNSRLIVYYSYESQPIDMFKLHLQPIEETDDRFTLSMSATLANNHDGKILCSENSSKLFLLALELNLNAKDDIKKLVSNG
ncbi:MAG: tetratricopeptide repeat protein [Cyclobacteriaceae bacterium]|nr:tetratricopeptide repeat protein [Cyclobacteriaceae bacterium]MCH8516744.1 tetratricopeptide repeat protein [Cyclobacteriaceae bacterium]